MFFATALVITWMIEKQWRLRTKQAHASLVLCDNTANAQELLCTLKDGTYWKILTSQNYNIRPKVYQAKGQKNRYCKPKNLLAWFQTPHVIWPC